MPGPNERWTDERVELIIGNLLRIGVLIAAAVVAVGGVFNLLRIASQPMDHRLFRAEPPDLVSIRGIIGDAFSLKSVGIIQLGILFLLATPIARVAFSVFAFAKERDLTYVIVTLIVLGLLLFSLFQSG